MASRAEKLRLLSPLLALSCILATTQYSTAKDCDEWETVDILRGEHRSDRGDFKFSSRMSESNHSNRCDAIHIVCNRDPARGLIFKWRGPNFSVGAGGRLRPGECGGISRTLEAFEADHSANIRFTPRADQRSAPAYVSLIDTPWLPGVAETIFRRHFGVEASPEAIETIDSNINYSQSYYTYNDGIDLEIETDRKSIFLYFDIRVLSGYSIDDFFFLFSDNDGIAVRYGRLSDISDGSLRNEFPEIQNTYFIRIEQENREPISIRTTLPPG